MTFTLNDSSFVYAEDQCIYSYGGWLLLMSFWIKDGLSSVAPLFLQLASLKTDGVI